MSANEPVAPVEPTIEDQVNNLSAETQQPPEKPKADATPESPESGPDKSQETEKPKETEQDRNWRALRESRDFLERDNRDLRRRLDALETQSTGEPEKEATEPDPEAYGLTPEKFTLDGFRRYQRDMRTFIQQTNEQTIEQRFSKFREELQGETSRSRVEESWAAQVAGASEKYPDFREVAFTAPITDDTAEAIREMENGAEVAYYLGKHPDEVARLSVLSGRNLDRALGRIEARLETPPPSPAPPKTTAAPPPPKTVGTGTAEQDKSPGAAKSFREFEDALRAEVAKRR